MMTISLQKLKRRDNDGKQWPTGEEESSAAHDDTSRGGDDNNGQMTLFGGSVSKSPGRERNNERPFDHSNNNKPQWWRKWRVQSRPSKSRPTSTPIQPSDDNNARVHFTSGSVSKSPGGEQRNKKIQRWSKWRSQKPHPPRDPAAGSAVSAFSDYSASTDVTRTATNTTLLPSTIPFLTPSVDFSPWSRTDNEPRNEVARIGTCSAILCLSACLRAFLLAVCRPACLLLAHALPQTNHNTKRT
jgi:hypothetical protein